MPIEITAETMRDEELQSIESLMYDSSGNYTPMAETVAMFLDHVDWTALFEQDEDENHVVVSEVFVRVADDGSYVESDEGEEGSFKVEVEEISSEAIENILDIDDMVAMFEWFLGELPAETLEEKARLAAFGIDVSEKVFKKGAFKKIHKAGGKDIVARMLIAMQHKQAIKRAKKPGAGYAGGDYMKAAGYGAGSWAKRKGYERYTKKKEAVSKKMAKAQKKQYSILKRFVAKAGKKKKPVKKGKKKIVANYKKDISNISEHRGPNLAAGMLNEMSGAGVILVDSPTKPKDGDNK